MLISVVIPCYYSEKMIGRVVSLTREQLIGAGYSYEFILVNDGSTDGTFRVISEMAEEDENIVGIDPPMLHHEFSKPSEWTASFLCKATDLPCLGSFALVSFYRLWVNKTTSLRRKK